MAVCPFIQAAEDSPDNENKAKAIKGTRIEACHDKVVIILNQREEEHDHTSP